MSNLIVSEAAFSRVIRAGDSNRFKVKLKTNREAIVQDCITKALAGDVQFHPNYKTIIRRKPCVSIPDYNSQLVLRSISRFLMRRLRIALPNRDLIVSEVIQTLSDRTPMHIIRRDIKSFYENVDAKTLRSKLEFSSAIPSLARRYIAQYFEKFCDASGYGLPRGIGLSAVLVEYAMQDFDQRIREIDGVYRYYRFSDDMLIFCFKDPNPIIAKIESNLLHASANFSLNAKKSGLLSLTNTLKKSRTIQGFDYLGYHFEFEDLVTSDRPRQINVSIASSKITKLKTKIILSLKDHDRNLNYPLLRDRLRYLSGNYKVQRGGMTAVRDSFFIKSGIYFSYRLCGEYLGSEKRNSKCAELRELDNFYQNAISNKKSKHALSLSGWLTGDQMMDLRLISFRRGHELKLFVRFEPEQLDAVKRIWRNV